MKRNRILWVIMAVLFVNSVITVKAASSESEKVVYTAESTWHSAAITEDGDLYCWGYNLCGEVGNGKTKMQKTPVKVLENVTDVCLGGFNSAAITKNGDLYCWGSNSYGQIGNGTAKNQTTPQKILKNVVSVSMDGDFCAAITKNGDLYCWGYNLLSSKLIPPSITKLF